MSSSEEFLGIIWLGKLYRSSGGYRIQRLDPDEVMRSEPKLETPLDLVQIAAESGISFQEYLDKLREFCFKYSKLKLAQIPAQQELVKAVRLYDGIQSQIQKLRDQLREWRGVYEARSQQVPQIIPDLEKALESLESKLVGIREFISQISSQICPKLRSIAGDLIAARLIEAAGGLDSLAKMPSSRIQVLGARMRSRSKPPKHGIIYQHPEIKSAPKSQRGKLAKQLAFKIALAARSDWFGKLSSQNQSEIE